MPSRWNENSRYELIFFFMSRHKFHATDVSSVYETGLRIFISHLLTLLEDISIEI